MTKILHIIGPQGVGKSTLAQQLQGVYRAQDIYCANLTELGMHEPSFDTDLRPMRTHGVRKPYRKALHKFDVLIVEHLGDPGPNQVEPGDLLIRMEIAA